MTRGREDEAGALLKQKGIRFEEVADILLLVHPLCQECIGRPCLEAGTCPFEFALSQVKLDTA